MCFTIFYRHLLQCLDVPPYWTGAIIVIIELYWWTPVVRALRTDWMCSHFYILNVPPHRAEAILFLAVVNSSRRSITHHLNMPPYFVLSQCASLSWYSIFALQRWILVGRVLSMCPHSVMMQWHAYCSCFCRVVCTRLLKYHFCWDSPVNCINLASTQWADWDII